jgi:hypothetical protein
LNPSGVITVYSPISFWRGGFVCRIDGVFFKKYWIEYIKVRHHEEGIKVSEVARELNTCGVPTKREVNGRTSKFLEF